MGELIITRSLNVDALEPTGDGWTLHGLAVPYERDQEVSDDGGATTYLERFAAGAFAKDAARGGRWVNLMLGHKGDDGERYLGRCFAMRETNEGLLVDFRLNRDHPRAEEARSGELRGWSVSAKAYRTRKDRVLGRERRIRVQCGLMHVAATPFPQYAGAGVILARSRTPILDQLRTEQAELRASRDARLSPITAAETDTYRKALRIGMSEPDARDLARLLRRPRQSWEDRR